MPDVLGLLTGGSTAPPAVRRLAFAVKFAGGGGGGGGGLAGGLAATAAGALGLGSGSADPWKQSVVSINVELGLAPAVDVVELYLAANQQAPVVAVGDSGSVSLGYDDSSTDLVFTGQVESIRRGANGLTRITATNGSATLSRLRVNQSFEGQKAGDMVANFVSQSGVESDTVEDGADFPFYVADDRRSAYEHITALARKCGFLAYFTPEGKLNFAPFTSGQAVQTFTYGTDILALEVTEAAPPIGTTTTIGEGAAGSHGKDAWNWLVKDPSAVTATAGDGAPQRMIQDSSLRTGDTAQKAADGIANAAAQMKLAGTLFTTGAPATAVGKAIAIVGAPADSLNGLYLVHGVRHRLNKDQGFTSLINISKVDSAGGSSGLAGLLGGLL